MCRGICVHLRCLKACVNDMANWFGTFGCCCSCQETESEIEMSRKWFHLFAYVLDFWSDAINSEYLLKTGFWARKGSRVRLHLGRAAFRVLQGEREKERRKNRSAKKWKKCRATSAVGIRVVFVWLTCGFDFIQYEFFFWRLIVAAAGCWHLCL